MCVFRVYIAGNSSAGGFKFVQNFTASALFLNASLKVLKFPVGIDFVY